jgi:C-methyltransferase-like protein/putative zinc binding protein/methyltransferase family protein
MSTPTQARADVDRATEHRCRSCGAALTHVFVDLGNSPLANAYLSEAQLAEREPFYPLRVYVCDGCFLVQLPPAVAPAEMFQDYAYFSSYSDSWLRHARTYAEGVIERLGLDSTSKVIEIASNDGYLLKYFKELGVPVLGIEPAANVAAAAQQAGIPTLIEFFGLDTARRLRAEGEQGSLLVGNNVLAHVPDLTGFVEGLEVLLEPGGVVTMEFPHLLWLIENGEFDTIYHEHLFYFSLIAVERVFAQAGLTLFDVEELPTHGGSLRIYARHADDHSKRVETAVDELRSRERHAGLDRLDIYESFDERAREVKRGLLDFLIRRKREGKSIVGYGAAAKGNTLLNYCGIRRDFLDYVVDRSPHKQGLFLPGTHLPILDPGAVSETKPDYLLILPWNLRDEIMEQMSHVRAFGCKFVVPIPETAVYD